MRWAERRMPVTVINSPGCHDPGQIVAHVDIQRLGLLSALHVLRGLLGSIRW